MRLIVSSIGLLVLLFTVSLTYKTVRKIKLDPFVFIPSGTLSIDSSDHSLKAFYMSAHEVTNAEYRLFLNDLLKNNQLEDYQLALPDTSAWNLEGMYMQPMVNMYFRHPAYDNYPVVTISAEGANLYCQWLTKKYIEKYGQENVGEIRLPNKYEWMYAAQAGIKNVYYSWGHNDLKNSTGCYLANFKQNNNVVERDSINKNPCSEKDDSQDGALFTALAKSYEPNEFGLYNMCGNVSELIVSSSMISDKSNLTKSYNAIGGNWSSNENEIRINSEISFEKPNPYVGFRPIMTHMKTN